MRRPFVASALLFGAIGAMVACAATGAQDSTPEPPVDPSDAGSTVLGDAHVPPLDATDEGFGKPQLCSPAGWCTTELPANGLLLHEVWPVGARAFAVGEAEDLGTKFLEWDAIGGWKFIDRKIEFGVYELPTNVWAPDENEVFFAAWNLGGLVGGSFGGIVFHGTRPVPPETSWSWTRTRIDCEGLSFFQFHAAKPFVSGTGRDEVYTAVCGSVYRLNRNAPVGDAGLDGGPASLGERWELDYSDGDEMFGGFSAVSATKSGDMLFAGVRSASVAMGGDECVLLIRKSGGGYTTLIDGVPNPGAGCVAKPGAAMLEGRFGDVHALAEDVVVAPLQSGATRTRPDQLARVAVVDGEVRIATASAAETFDGDLVSVWGTSPDDLWVLSSRLTGGSIILRATSVWDGGAFAFSTLAINGAPNAEELFRIRGTSNENIWAVGRHRAFFKSTP